MSEPVYPNEDRPSGSAGAATSAARSPIIDFVKRLELMTGQIQNIEGRVNQVLESVTGITKGTTPERPVEPTPGPGYGGYLQDLHRSIDAAERALTELTDRLQYLEQI